MPYFEKSSKKSGNKQYQPRSMSKVTLNKLNTARISVLNILITILTAMNIRDDYVVISIPFVL